MKKFLWGIFIITLGVIPVLFVSTITFAQHETTTDGGNTGKTEIIGTTTVHERTATDIGINFWGSCLTWMGRWCFDMGKLTWIEKNQRSDISAMSIIQDIVYWATYMVWTILTIIIIYCGLCYIFASRDWKDVSKYRNWLIYAAIWAVLVWWAFAMVRLIQYIAKW